MILDDIRCHLHDHGIPTLVLLGALDALWRSASRMETQFFPVFPSECAYIKAKGYDHPTFRRS